MTNILPSFIKEQILQMPEYKYGVNKVIVRLKNGQVYGSIHVAWGDEIVKVGQNTEVPFDAEDVVEVQNDLTPD